MMRFGRLRTAVTAAFFVGLVAACGGGDGGGSSDSGAASGTGTGTGTGTGGGGSGGGGGTTTTPLANSMTVTVDSGSAAVRAAGFQSVNQLFATVTVCTPGSTTACATIDHVQVDTGSIGLRLFASQVASAVARSLTDPTSGNPLRECVQFADGYSWGSVAALDVQLGGRTVPSLPVHLIGDPAAGNAPSSCVSGPSENTPADFGSNGIIGVGAFIQDCGPACATTPQPATYYTCATVNGTGTCTPVAVATSRQVSNPISSLASDNNGLLISLPAVPINGQSTLTGTMYFGVGTQADNALGNARVYTLSGSGTFTAVYNGSNAPGSFIDSGSNAYFFGNRALTVCPDNTGFYCPAAASTQSATIIGTNNASTTVTFTITNADQGFSSNNAVLPGLGGPASFNVGGTASYFDFGLPFFYGRNVYTVIEGGSAGGVAGPAVAF